MAERVLSRRAITIASLAVFAVALFVFRLCARPGASGDPIPARHIPISLLTEGDLDLDEFPGITEAPNPYYLARHGGHVYSVFPPAGGVLATPFFAAARALGADVLHDDDARLSVAAWVASIASAFTVAVMFASHAARGPGRGLLVATALAFGTGLWPVASQDLWQHTFGVPLVAVVITILEWRGASQRWLAVAGAVAGVAVAVRPTNSVLVGALALYVLTRGWRGVACFATAAALFVVPQLLYNLLQFGHAEGAYTKEVGYLKPLLMLPTGFPGLLVSPARGLFVLSPVLLLGGWAFRRTVEPERLGLRWAMAAAIVAECVLFGSYRLWWGGWCFGPRHLLEVMPLAASLVGYGWTAIGESRAGRGLALVALAGSIATNGLGARLGTQQWDAHPGIDWVPRRLWDLRDNPLVSDFLGLDPANRYARYWAPGAYRIEPGAPLGDETKAGAWLLRGWTERAGVSVPVGMGRKVELLVRLGADDRPARIVLRLRAAPRLGGRQTARVALGGRMLASVELDEERVHEVEIPIDADGPFERPYRVSIRLSTWRHVDWRDTFRALLHPETLDLRPDSVVLEGARIEGAGGATELFPRPE